MSIGARSSSSCQRCGGPPHRHRVVHRSDAVDYRQGSYAGDQQPGVGFVGVTGDQVGEGLAVAADRCPHAANNLQARAAAMAAGDHASPDAPQGRL
jgi:hypothetical protein